MNVQGLEQESQEPLASPLLLQWRQLSLAIVSDRMQTEPFARTSFKNPDVLQEHERLEVAARHRHGGLDGKGLRFWWEQGKTAQGQASCLIEKGF